MNVGIIVAAGRSERMGKGKGVDKAFINLGTKPVLAYSVIAFEECPDIDEVVLVVRKDRIGGARGMSQMFGCSKVSRIVAGGKRRQDSVMLGLDATNEEGRIVCVHDGARPCVSPELISDTIKSAKRYGSGVAACKITDTVKLVEKGHIVTRTVDRAKLWAVQTPQTFRRDLLVAAFAGLKKGKVEVTDEALAVEQIGEEVHLVPSTAPNVKITTPEDLVVAAALLEAAL